MLPDDHSGIIAGFRATLRFFRRLAWVGIFITLVLILTLTEKSAR